MQRRCKLEVETCCTQGLAKRLQNAIRSHGRFVLLFRTISFILFRFYIKRYELVFLPLYIELDKILPPSPRHIHTLSLQPHIRPPHPYYHRQPAPLTGCKLNWLERRRLRALSVFWAVRRRSLTLSEQTVESIGFQITAGVFSCSDITRECGRCGRSLAAQYGLVTRMRLAFWIPSVLLLPTSPPFFFPRRSSQGGPLIFFFLLLYQFRRCNSHAKSFISKVPHGQQESEHTGCC